MDDLKALACELLAAEYERADMPDTARVVRNGEYYSRSHYDACVRAIEAALSRPAGGEWVMVPREPTPEMLAAPQTHDSPLDDGTRRIWAAMLAAAPTPHGGEDAWQPIETAPDGIEALVTGYNYGEPSKGRYYSAAKLDGGAWYGTAADDGDDQLGWLTHWRPLTNPDTAIAASREVGA